MYRILSPLLLILLSPVLTVAWIAVKLDSKGPFIFTQKRMGKNGKPFTIYKIRTMVEGAERMQKKLLSQNEADGPVFKIHDDPRYTRVGRFLSHTAIDEIPQLWNVARGEMSFVGPRPLPLYEAKRVPRRYEERFSVLPGMTSSWIVGGAHNLTFEEWMRLDVSYARRHSFFGDMGILAKTAGAVLLMLLRNI